MSQAKAISLFSGAGGDTLGMSMANINVISYVENDKHAIETHDHNFSNCKLIGKDITKIEDSEFEKFNDTGIDIIFGGFPCQSFSHGGKKNAADKRGFLYQEFVRAARIIKPKIIIGENVKGLLSRKKPNGDLIINDIIKAFEDIGYVMKYTLFNMKDYGIPQDRQRILIYGIRNDLDIILDLSEVEKSTDHKYIKDISVFSLENALKITSPNIISLVPEDKYIEDMSDMSDTSEPFGKPPTNLIKCYNEEAISFRKRSKPNYSCIVDKNDFSKTIISTYNRMPRLFVPIKNSTGLYIRPYTILELQRIQGFPDDFVFCGGDMIKIKQIGNAIPPLFIYKIMMYILSKIN